MAEYRYTTEDRRKQLTALAAALRELIPVVEGIAEFASRAAQYEASLRTTEGLLHDGFTLDQLTALGDAVPDLYYRHREWLPPTIRMPSGELCEPEWFMRLESKLQPALKAAEVLRLVGYY